MRHALRGAIVIFVASILGTGIASATLFGDGNVRASFGGWLTPHTLPRTGLAPVALHMRGSLRTVDGSEPPQLRAMKVEVNRHGKLSTVGLPTCPERRLTATTTAQAFAACHDALVGGGSFSAHILIPTQPPFPAHGRLLAFNAVSHGRQVILAHIYGTDPAPTTRVLEMRVRHSRGGTYGTSLSVTLPNLGERWGHVTGFRLTLYRLYRYRGRTHSFLSAGCPAPAGLRAALFAAARGTYYLAGGRRVSRILDGSCKVGS